ncbi:unnamed protein product [Rotaria sp. Silwood2]|nr:unnamed protein product [Rotaria sp. Silwood2]
MGMLIPYNINPMSTFSFSLTLAIRSEYWHPQMFVDDVGFLITSMSATGERIRVRGLPVPVRSGPTSGETWSKDIKEWFIQVRRWGLAGPVVVAYCFVYFWAYHILAIRGKGVCVHRVAGKANLGETIAKINASVH